MTYDPRTIAFAAEILYPPQQLRADLVQNVHNTLYQRPQLGYQNFQVAPDGIHLSNIAQAPGQVSMASFMHDRLVIREEMRGSTVEDFATRAVNVATLAFQTCNIPTSIAQQFVVRSLIPPVSQTGNAFGRPMQSLGVRFVFPPHEEQQQTFQVRIETWPQDQRSIWLENSSIYASPLAIADMPRVADQLAATYSHLTGPVCSFLANLDTQQG